MIVSGAGGHAMETLDILLENKVNHDIICFFDNTKTTSLIYLNKYVIIKHDLDLKKQLLKSPDFCLGVGTPILRYEFYKKFTSNGGILYSVKSIHALISENNDGISGADIFPFVLIGPKVSIGFGSLINTRANIHHEVRIGKFTVIGPSATVLGAASIGEFCFVGSGVVILPNIEIGSNVIIGSGSVVTKNISDNSVVVGVPGKVIKELSPIEMT